MIEHHDTLRDGERMMIRNRDHAGAELDAMGDHRGGGQHHLGRRDRLPSSGVMLADPEFVVAEIIEERGELQIALQLQSGILAGRMMRCEKDAEAQTIFHSASSL